MTGVLGGKVASAFQQPGRVKENPSLTPESLYLQGCIRFPATRAGESCVCFGLQTTPN
jgi:hypothetical protein